MEFSDEFVHSSGGGGTRPCSISARRVEGGEGGSGGGGGGGGGRFGGEKNAADGG